MIFIVWGPHITMTQTAGQLPETRFLSPAGWLGQAQLALARSGELRPVRRAPAGCPFMILLAKSSKNPHSPFQNHEISWIFLEFS